jgi:hypothetical protein
VLGAERGFQGFLELRSRREGSQTLGTELPDIRATVFGRISQEMWKEGPKDPEMLKGEEAQARHIGLGCMVDMDPVKMWRVRRKRRSRWRRSVREEKGETN